MTPEKECLLYINGTRLLMPEVQALQVFQLLHGATVITQKYDENYKQVGWKAETRATLTLEHAEPTLRAKLILEE